MLDREDDSLPVGMGGKVLPALEKSQKEYVPPTCDLKKLTVSDLKYELTIRGLVPKGRKAALLDMLEDAISKDLPVDTAIFNTTQSAAKKDNTLSGFPDTAQWELLQPDNTPVTDPTNSLSPATSSRV